MVVGLLTILAILGASLLVVTYMDRLQSRAMAARSLADTAAQGVASSLAASMARGLRLTGAPYPYPDADSNRMLFVDSYANDSNAYWLSQYFYSQFGGAIAWVDTDGDGLFDSLLFPAGLYNSIGDAYYVAVQVRDTSRWLCVNTAGTADSALHALPRDGTAVNLQSLLGASYNTLHTNRAPGGGNLRAYDAGAVRLQEMLATRGREAVLRDVCGLATYEPLFARLLAVR